MYSEIKDKLCSVYKDLVSKYGQSSLEDYFVSVRAEDGKAIASFAAGTAAFESSNIVIIDENAKVVEGNKDLIDSRLAAHFLLYKSYPFMKCIIHGDSDWLSVWSGMGVALPPVTLRHVKNFFGEIQCVGSLPVSRDKQSVYVKVGLGILKMIETKFPYQTPAVFVRNFGAYVWGRDTTSTLAKLAALEETAKRSYYISVNRLETFSCLPFEIQRDAYETSENAMNLDTTVERIEFDEAWLDMCRENL